MKTNGKAQFFFLTLVIIIIFSSCFSEWSEDTGSLIINLGGNDGRSAMPSWPPEDILLDYKITLSGGGETITITAESGETISAVVSVGRWNVYVEAFFEGNLYAKSSGEDFVDVRAGQNNQVSIQMLRAFLNTYTVTFDANGGIGTVPPGQTVSYGSIITLPDGDGLTKSGFIFGGWNTDRDGEGTGYAADSSYTVTEDITLYAKWIDETKPYFAVIFNANGGEGTVPPVQEAISGSSIDLPNGSGLTKTGCTFDGWNTNEDGTGTSYAANSSYTVTDNITLYAKWNINRYTVTFDANGGSPTPPVQTIDHGGNVIEPSGITKSDGESDYNFAGWYTDNDTLWDFETPVTQDITLYAKWEVVPPGSFIVTFNSNEGSSVPGQVVESGGIIETPPPDPTRAGHTFAGWFKDNNTFLIPWNFETDTVDQPITLYAKWNVLSVFEVSDAAEWVNVVNTIKSGFTNTYTIYVIGDFSIDGYISSTFGTVSAVAIHGNNRTITLSSESTGSLLYIGENQTVTMTNLTLKGRAGNNAALVYINGSGAAFTMNSGSAVTGNTNSGGSGGGVYVNGGSFTMMIDSEVSGNTAGNDNGIGKGGGVFLDGGTFTMTDSAKVSGNTAQGRGSGSGGGVYVNSGTFTMNGGTVGGIDVGNRATVGTPAPGSGGGVYVDSNGTFTMTDGEVSGNTAGGTASGGGNGGGVYVVGTFTMNAGEVSGNAKVSRNSAENSNARGGGVYVDSTGTFTMNAGEVSVNTAGGTGSSGGTASDGGNGGGVYVVGTFTMNAGEVSGNTANGGGGGGGTGGGVYVVNFGTFTMSGYAKVSDNTVGGAISGGGGNGGGVYINGTNGTFTMSEYAEVSDNTAEGGSSGGGTGGGVSVYNGKFTMLGNSKVSGNTAKGGSLGGGGGVHLSGGNGTFTMDGGEVSGNTADVTGSGTGGGGVYVSDGKFLIVTGTIYGIDWIDQSLRNTSTATNNSAALYSYSGTAQYGTFSGPDDAWVNNGTLSTTNNTIKVLNGVLQSP